MTTIFRKGMPRVIPVVDLFAGPGGLSHGFSAFRSKDVTFDIKLSIEKDEVAWRTLLLRAFLRQFAHPPAAYYRFLRCEHGVDRDFLASEYPAQWAAAQQEARRWTLGEEPFSTVSAAISKVLGTAEQWILLGGPPCQAYSLAGRVRMKHLPQFSSDARHTLYREYLKIVAVHQPTMFVMENVKGMLSSIHGARGEATSVFARILADLRNPGGATATDSDIASLLPPSNQRHKYIIHSFVTKLRDPACLQPNDFVIKSEDWSVPQRRHRVFLFGVRADVNVSPSSLDDLFTRTQVNVEDVIGNLPKLRSRISGSDDSQEAWIAAIRQITRKTITTDIKDANVRRALTRELTRVSVRANVGAPYQPSRAVARKITRWLSDEKLGGVIQHQTRSHMPSDLLRYFFAACSAKETKTSP